METETNEGNQANAPGSGVVGTIKEVWGRAMSIKPHLPRVPSIGSIVHYVIGREDVPDIGVDAIGTVVPAIVTSVIGEDRCDLILFIQAPNHWSQACTNLAAARLFDASGEPGTWHWPPTV